MCGACVCSHAETHGCHGTITFLGYGCNCCRIGVHVLHKLDECFKEARLLCFHSVKLKQTLESLRQYVSPSQEMVCRSACLLFDQDPKLCEDFDWRLASTGSGMTKESGFANSGSCSETTLATTCVAVSSDSGLWFNQVSETPLTTGCMALFMSWILQNWWTQANAICSVKLSWHSCYRGRSYHSCDYGIMTYKEY